jgi:hypothetical protein
MESFYNSLNSQFEKRLKLKNAKVQGFKNFLALFDKNPVLARAVIIKKFPLVGSINQADNGSLPAPGNKVGMPVSITQEASSPCGNRKVMNADATHVAEGVFHPAESASTHTESALLDVSLRNPHTQRKFAESASTQRDFAESALSRPKSAESASTQLSSLRNPAFAIRMQVCGIRTDTT